MRDFFGICGLLLGFSVLCLLLIVVYALKESTQPQRFFDERASELCGVRCYVSHGSRYCVAPCPGPRCLCVRGVGGVWYFDETTGDE